MSSLYYLTLKSIETNRCIELEFSFSSASSRQPTDREFVEPRRTSTGKMEMDDHQCNKFDWKRESALMRYVVLKNVSRVIVVVDRSISVFVLPDNRILAGFYGSLVDSDTTHECHPVSNQLIVPHGCLVSRNQRKRAKRAISCLAIITDISP